MGFRNAALALLTAGAVAAGAVAAGTVVVGMVVATVAVSPAGASPVTWASWAENYTPSATAGAASAIMGGLSVSYTGEVVQVIPGYPSWGLPGTFNGGTVDNAPPASGGIVRLIGGLSTLDTITFSAPVTNPVMAIWSLGQSNAVTSFVFNQPFSIQSGGPSSEYAGQSITQTALTVLGEEGNGTIQFLGTFTQISWVNPQREDWYGFTVGAPEQTPIPAALPLLGGGLALLGLFARRRKRGVLGAAS